MRETKGGRERESKKKIAKFVHISKQYASERSDSLHDVYLL